MASWSCMIRMLGDCRRWNRFSGWKFEHTISVRAGVSILNRIGFQNAWFMVMFKWGYNKLTASWPCVIRKFDDGQGWGWVVKHNARQHMLVDKFLVCIMTINLSIYNFLETHQRKFIIAKLSSVLIMHIYNINTADDLTTRIESFAIIHFVAFLQNHTVDMLIIVWHDSSR